jgi:hypothetical protein
MKNQSSVKGNLSDYIGHTSQIGGTQRLVVDEGKGKGTSVIRVRNGIGLDFTLLPDKGLDILDVQLGGVQLAWISRNGLVANSHFDGSGEGWLRSFGGGMLTTCGLRNVGPPEEDEGEHFGLHGRFSGIPARHVNTTEHWKNGTLFMEVSGEISETNVFGEELVLRRTYRMNSVENSIEMTDRISNQGSTSQQLLLLYHMNWGFPLLTSSASLQRSPGKVVVRGADQSEVDLWNIFSDPTQDYMERVYFFDLQADKEGEVFYQLENRTIDRGVRVSWKKEQLPVLTEWKMMGKGDYVLGLEPGNTFPIGRKGTRDQGQAEFLEAGETKEVSLKIEFLSQLP